MILDSCFEIKNRKSRIKNGKEGPARRQARDVAALNCPSRTPDRRPAYIIHDS
jgi:hypothetical protein